ncbi:unnamed protein product [Choristocarpus tenellus]
MDAAAEGIDITKADSWQPGGQFTADYISLCRIFDVTPHPCLQRSVGSGEGIPETCVAVRNFALDRTTLLLMLKVLKESKHVTTLQFYNAGLPASALSALADALPSTPVCNLAIDYNPLVEDQSESEIQTGEPLQKSGQFDPFAIFLGTTSKLRYLSLRGNRITDIGAAAIAEEIEGNKLLGSLNMFDNLVTDKGAATLVEALKLNSSLRGLSLAKNRLNSASAGSFGDILAGYEATPTLLAKRKEVDNRIAAHNKTVQEAMKKKKDANVELMIPLGAILPQVEEGEGNADKEEVARTLVAGSPSLMIVNLNDNAGLSASPLLAMLERLTEARGAGRAKGGEGGLQAMHIQRCGPGGEDEEWSKVMTAAEGLHPSEITIQ